MNEAAPNFEKLMQEGVKAHTAGDYATALEHRFDAFAAQPPLPGDRGRAARDISASFDRLGGADEADRAVNAVLADAYAEYAYREHRDLRDLGDMRGTREFTATAMYVAIRAVREGDGSDALAHIREGWEVGQQLRARHDGKSHQYDVNMVGRVAGIEAVFGGKPSKAVRKLGREAIRLAGVSETPAVLGANSRLGVLGLLKAQGKALARGVAANVIIGLESLPTRKRTRSLVNRLLQKVVL